MWERESGKLERKEKRGREYKEERKREGEGVGRLLLLLERDLAMGEEDWRFAWLVRKN